MKQEDWGIANLRLVATCLWLSGAVLAISSFFLWAIAGGVFSAPVVVLAPLAVAVLLSAAVVQTEIRPRVSELEQRRTNAGDA